jgi:hypothetical protein
LPETHGVRQSAAAELSLLRVVFPAGQVRQSIAPVTALKVPLEHVVQLL